MGSFVVARVRVPPEYRQDERDDAKGGDNNNWPSLHDDEVLMPLVNLAGQRKILVEEHEPRGEQENTGG